MKKKRASSTIYTIFFFMIFLAFCALAVDGTIVYTNRARLQSATEATALAAASEFGDTNATAVTVEDVAKETFNLIKYKGLANATITVSVNANPNIKQVLIVARSVSQPFFLSFLGVNGVNIEARACAISEALPVTANYLPTIKWLTPNATYSSDILSKDLNFYNTAILLPLGGFPSASYQSNMVDLQLIDKTTVNMPLSLGPGGFITIKLPAPIINKPGPDLFIKEIGNSNTQNGFERTLEGYLVFAGIDNNPANPYVQYDNEGDKICWVNISRAGKPENPAFHEYIQTALGAKLTGDNVKFYGSGYFDLDDVNLSMVKYIRIVDDNSESAFVTNDGINYFKTMLLGEASTVTSGADIDYVEVLNHVRLKPPSSYGH